MENKILTLSQYKKSLGKSFKKGDTMLPMNTIFEVIPDTVDYRLLKHILENWSLYYHKSPYSHSYYSHKVGWTYKPHKSERLSDHWDFKSGSGKRKHCQTISADPKLNENVWSIGVYDSKKKKYKIILSYPFIKSDENQEKKRKLQERFIEEHGDQLINDFSKNIQSLDNHKENMITISEFLTSNKNNFDIYINDEKIDANILNISVSKLRYEEDGKINNIKFTRSTSRGYDIKIYYKDTLIAFRKNGKKRLRIPDGVTKDIINGVLT